MKSYFAIFSLNASSLRWVALIVLLSILQNNVTADVTQPSPVTNKREYLLGVFPYLAPRELEKMYSPVAADYSNVIGASILFRTNSTYESFMENLDKQLFDIVFVQPFDYVSIADKYGYRPLATRNKPLPAIFVVNPQSSFKSVEDLRGKTIALPPAVAAISYLIKNYLSEHEIDPRTDVIIKHFDSHGSCMRNVLIGNADACGTAPPALRFFESKMNTKLKVIAKTKGIPNSIFAVHPRVTKEMEDKLRSRIVSWQTTPEGKKLLEGLKVEMFVPALDSDYDAVRAMAKKYRTN
ncbi:MAG: phosphate/phosphite/phosphonate ABC transporter substrate-binding protein [Gammaproteobacteria bacterium]|jgi:phosphonate transport system substrate-binding protein